MSAVAPTARPPSLAGWVLRDGLITVGVAAALWGLHVWHAHSASWASASVGAGFAFVAAYALCYIYHEWGHLIGATCAGAHMPPAPYAGVLIGTFDITQHTRRQFLWLSWGGVLAYASITGITLSIHFGGRLGVVGAGLAVGGLAFLVQSLAVDLPQIWRVARGADIAETSARGASPAVILRRTWQTWIPLAILLAGWSWLT